MTRITVDAARRIALGAQGLSRPLPPGRRDRRHFRKVFDQIGVLQLDSVNVVVRSHYLPVFARIGHYDRAALDAYTSHTHEVFEYWAHEASLLPSRLYPWFEWRRREARPWGRIRALEDEFPGYIEAVYEEIAAHGPLTVGQLSDPGTRVGPWWGHGRGRVALDWLFATGRITAIRNGNFGRLYDLPQRLIHPEHFAAEPLPKKEAYRRLLDLSARHHGIGTAKDLADYYRLHTPTARPILEAMAEAGELRRVEVREWRGPVYLHPEAKRPRRLEGAALLSPFDPLIWERDRVERLFGFRYRIEIYVPKPKRVHGYYVLPFLLDGELVGRVDLKAHRERGTLEARAAFVEDGHDAGRVAEAMAVTLEAMSQWLALGDVAVARKGNLAAALAASIG